MIQFVSHRGNLSGPLPSRENEPSYIDEALALSQCSSVEIDVRMVGDEFFLGHDYPQYRVTAAWLNERSNKLLMHLKDVRSLKFILRHRFHHWHYFCHAGDAFTHTSHGMLWLHNISLEPDHSTIVPLMTRDLVLANPYRTMAAICSDFQVNEHGDLVHNG